MKYLYQSKSKFKFYNEDSNVDEINFNTIVFKNIGDTPVVINGALLINPGEVVSNEESHPETIDATNYSIAFAPGTGGVLSFQGGAGTFVNPCLLVITKHIIKIK